MGRNFTLKILSVFFQWTTFLRLFPIKFNKDTFLFEPLQGKSLYIVYLHVFSELLFAIFVVTSRVLIWKGVVAPKSFTGKELHTFFMIAFSTSAFLNLHLLLRRHEIISWIAHFVKFRKKIEDLLPSSSRTRITWKERILQFAVIYTMVFVPISFVRMFLRDPFDKRFPLFLLNFVTEEFEWSTKIIVAAYALIHLWHAVVYIYVINLYVLSNVLCIHLTSSWIQILTQALKAEARDSEILELFHQVSVLNKISCHLLASVITPFLVFINNVMGITLSYFIIAQHNQLEFYAIVASFGGAVKGLFAITIVQDQQQNFILGQCNLLGHARIVGIILITAMMLEAYSNGCSSKERSGHLNP